MNASMYVLDKDKLHFVDTGNYINSMNKHLFSKYAQEGDKIYEMVANGKPIEIYWAESTIEKAKMNKQVV